MIAFVVPIKTVNVANSREHWRARSVRVKRERSAVRLAWLGAGSPPIPTPSVATLTRVAPRMLDPGDGLPCALKGCRDEIAAIAGVDDRCSEIIEYRYAQRKPDRPKSTWVEVEIRAREVAA